MNWIQRKTSRLMGTQAPDVIIGGADDPYMLRWWVIPRNRFFNIYLHRFLRSDDDRALHDHPWLFNASYIVEGSYLEKLSDNWNRYDARVALEGSFKFRWGKAKHRVRLIDEFCTTIFITGPVVREWGFYCFKGWVHWRVFTGGRDGAGSSIIGRGCE